MRNSVLLILVIFILSCSKDDDGFILYEVKAHNHYCTHEPTLYTGKHSLDFWFKTNSTWVWDVDGGWSKIAGFSEGFHRDGSSCRLGYKNGVVALWAYADGESSAVVLDTIGINKTYFCRLSREGGDYVARMNGKEARVRAGTKKDWGYRLFPYVGGTYTLGHTWIVPIKYE